MRFYSEQSNENKNFVLKPHPLNPHGNKNAIFFELVPFFQKSNYNLFCTVERT